MNWTNAIDYLHQAQAVSAVKFMFWMLGIIVLTCWYDIRKERNERGSQVVGLVKGERKTYGQPMGDRTDAQGVGRDEIIIRRISEERCVT